MASVIIKLMTGDQLILISVFLLESLSEKSMAGQGSHVEPRNSKQRFKENTKFRNIACHNQESVPLLFKGRQQAAHEVSSNCYQFFS